MKDSSTNNFIIQLLNKIPDARLGGSYSSLSKHSFFNGIDWVKFHHNLGKISQEDNRASLQDP